MARHAQLTAIVFDVGNVLVDWSPRHLYRKLFSDVTERERFLDEVVTLDWHFQHDAGARFAETLPQLIARFPHYEAEILAYRRRWLETVNGEIPGMGSLLCRLVGLSPLYAITNFSAELYPDFAKSYPIMTHFRGVLVSGVERLVKPDPAIFQLAIQRFNLEPATTLFIDDRTDNVAAAQQLGFRTHLFVDAASLITTLMDYGLPMDAPGSRA